jgi:DNA modification methylase
MTAPKMSSKAKKCISRNDKLRKMVLDENIPFIVQNTTASEFLQELPDNCVDAIITDPPYNLAGYSTGNIAPSWRTPFNNDIAEWDLVSFEPEAYLEEFVRVLKPTGTIFAFTTYNLIGRWHTAFDQRFDTFQIVVWHKTNPAPKLRRAGFLNACEFIVACWNRGHKWNFTTQREMHNFIEGPICMGHERIRDPFHPTQKPVYVLRHLISLATDQGDLVVDPFMGVGSTGVAALELGRRFAGSEIDKSYYNASKKRLGAINPNLLSLNSERVSKDGV